MSDAPPLVEIAPALAADRAAIASMMQLYTHDFSEQWAGTPRGELGDDGRFPDYPLDPWWRDEDCIPLLIRAGGKLAGFALLNRVTHTGNLPDRNMAEFFVVRKHRGSGVALTAAHEILRRHPGVWEAAVARKNLRALAFWRKVVAMHPLAVEAKEHDVATAAWNGPVLRFRITPPATD